MPRNEENNKEWRKNYLSEHSEEHKAWKREYYLRNKEKYQEANRKLRAKSRDYILDSKKGKVCLDCGFSDYRILHYHHLGNKEFTIGSDAIRKKMSADKIQREIDKCILLCPNCHAIRHLSDTEQSLIA